MNTQKAQVTDPPDCLKEKRVKMDKLKNIDVYVQRMQKSFLDKMFFVDKIFEPVETIVDFGCANGVLIRAMHFKILLKKRG